MPSKREIEVFMIGKTQVDEDEVQRWMDYMNVTSFELPEEEILSNPAAIIAMAGKRCYQSWEVNKALNPNITRIRKDYASYFDNILKSGHGCYDGETDVLTSEGWKPFPEVDGTELFATLLRCGQVGYLPAVKVIHKPYKGDMVRVESSGVDLLVTPDHQMWVCPTTTKNGRKREFQNYRAVDAGDLLGGSHAYMKCVDNCDPDRTPPGDNPPEAFRLSNDEAAILGFAIGDGYYAGGKTVRFRLRRERKIAWLESIAWRNNWNLRANNDRYTLYLGDSRVVSLFGDIYDENGEKRVPPGFLAGATIGTQQALYVGLLQSDGSEVGTGVCFDTTSESLVDQFQQLCLHVGLAVNKGYTLTSEDRPTSYGSKPITRLHVIRRNLKPEVNKYAGCKGKVSLIPNWAGDVYCVSLADPEAISTRMVYVRRNGIPVWSGNSVLEHSVYNLAIEGVTRVFTAEMNRHRAGWAISEGSLRFIRFGENVPYWEPDSIRGPDVVTSHWEDKQYDWWMREENPAVVDELTLEERKQLSRRIFKEAFADQEKHYRFLQAIWAKELSPESKFKGKKQITSMMRRIIGLGVCTGGVWSGNIRALRHVITMRASEHAEEEILRVFSTVAKTLVEKEPLLFGDFEQTEGGFWAPKYIKV